MDVSTKVKLLLAAANGLTNWGLAAVALRCARRLEKSYKPAIEWLTQEHCSSKDAFGEALLMAESCSHPISSDDSRNLIYILYPHIKVLDVLGTKEDRNSVNHRAVEVARCALALVMQFIDPLEPRLTLGSLTEHIEKTGIHIDSLIDGMERDIRILNGLKLPNRYFDPRESGPLGALDIKNNNINNSIYNHDKLFYDDLPHLSNASYSGLPLPPSETTNFNPEGWLSETVKHIDVFREQSREAVCYGIDNILKYHINQNIGKVQPYEEKVKLTATVNSLLNSLGMAIEYEDSLCYMSTSKGRGYPNGRYHLVDHVTNKHLINRVHLADFMNDLEKLEIGLRKSLELTPDSNVIAPSWQDREDARNQASNQKLRAKSD